MKILSEAQLIREGWVKEGAVWHSPVRKLPEEIVESTRRAAEVKRRLESQRPNAAAMRARLVESWRSMGLSAEAAEKAADIRR
jgi:hypothetical protein